MRLSLTHVVDGEWRAVQRAAWEALKDGAT
jgi:hypothetical protein